MITAPAVVKVQLTWADVAYAAHVGVRRRIESLRDGYAPQGGAPQYSPMLWGQDIDAAAAELAVACYLDRAWTGEIPRAEFDVAPDIQVRHTWHPAGHLIVRERDRLGRYVLVVGHDGNFDLLGWLDSTDCRRAEWAKKNGNKYWMVPADRLQPMEALR
jgi:hypothetical protein